MKSQFLIGLSVLCVGSLILNAYQWHRSRSFHKQETVQHESYETASPGVSERKKELLKKRIETLEKEKSQMQFAKQTNEMNFSKNAEIARSDDRQDSPFRELFRSPEMREFMKARQRGALAESYKDFVTRLALTPQEREKFLDLITEKQTQFADRTHRWSQTSTNQFDAMENKLESELQQLLGPSRYAQYETYQKTLGQRTAMNQFEQQITLSESPLQPYQRDQLLQIMVEENRNDPFSGMRQREMMRQLSQFDETTAQQYFASQQKANERVLLRAQTVLNAKQLEQFKEFQNGMLKIQQTSLKVLRDRANRQNQQN